MLTRSLVLASALTAAATTALAQAPAADAAIESAIKAGATRKYKHLISDCYATAGFGAGLAGAMVGGANRNGALNITVATNLGRIAFLAAEAKRFYKPFAAADVPADLREPGIYVWVEPDEPSGSRGELRFAPVIEHVVLKSKADDTRVMQPLHVELEPVEWKNMLGATIEGNRASASFPAHTFQEMPPGDVDVAVVTQAGERRCKIGTSDRARLAKLLSR